MQKKVMGPKVMDEKVMVLKIHKIDIFCAF